MRNLINIIKLAEDAAVQLLQNTNVQELEAFKQALAGRIKELPPDDSTVKALREIEDLLKNVHAGGKVGIINGQLQQLNDPTVTAAQKELARYILSLDFSPEEREELFAMWGADKIVDRKKLLSPGKKNLSDIISGYNKPKIREFVDDMMHIAALGQGKGEFGLSVLSKNINKPQGKGDLLIDGKKIEAKTTDGGAGRFTDQEVRPGEGFEAAARKLNAFVKEQGIGLPASGLSISKSVEVGAAIDPKLKANYYKLLELTINIIFNSSQNVTPIIQAIKSGNKNAALQEYAKANFNYYMSKKDDEGVLYINLAKDPITTVFFRDANELAKSGLRLHAGTIYITSIADVRLPYPQMEIVDTSGGTLAAPAEPGIGKAAAKAAKVQLKTPKASAPVQPTAAPAPATPAAPVATAPVAEPAAPEAPVDTRTPEPRATASTPRARRV